MARIFNTYGPRMHPNDGRVVSSFVVQALVQEPITVFGDGLQRGSFCYVDDLIGALVAFMESDPALTGPINLGNPVETTIRNLAELVLRLSALEANLLRPSNERPEAALSRHHSRQAVS